MKIGLLFAVMFVVSTSVLGQTPSPAPNLSQTNIGEPPIAGIMWIRGFDPIGADNTFLRKHVNMSYHGGPIMVTAVSKNIFWGPSWNNPTFVGDKITGLDSFYIGFSNSNYAKTSDEYTGTNGTVGPVITHQGSVIDPSTATNGSSSAAILAEVCRMIPNPDPSGNGYYSVYTDVKRGSAGFCAYHSTGTCQGIRVQFAFHFNLDGDTSCDPADTSGQHSQGLAALANVTAHELSEARTDPTLTAWFDSKGQENGDKCAWTFNVPLVPFTNGTEWKVQGEWSNASYTAGTGYPNRDGDKGCLDGH
jgi:hypothetical protein